ncbi:MAG TPA: sulfate ABC transporter substrate-binding protein [Methylocystis sp.]|nr:sulfate ABC transporter substrate-binding protein [Methylocystis sp.]
MRGRSWLNLFALAAAAAGLTLIAVTNAPGEASIQLLNVSYDPTRELYQKINALFLETYEKETGRRLTIVQSHGGSSSQARRILSGELKADVVTLGLYLDVDSLRKRGLVADKWAERLPNHSSPYTSTIVFVVRRGNPRKIKDWPDLVQPGLEVVTPDPRTSGNGKLTALAAWAAVVTRGGSEDDAKGFLQELYLHAPSLAEGARGAAIAFADQEQGDVHLTWENEAIREIAQSKGRLAVVYPPVSIRAEPAVAWLDKPGARKGDLAPAKAYLEFLYSDAAQQEIAKLGYRPLNPDIALRAGVKFPQIELVAITEIARDWDDASEKFFAENGVIDNVIGTRKP